MTESTINFNPAKFAGGVAKSFVSATKSTIASYMPFTSELLQDASDTAFDIRSYINENRPDKTSRNSSGILRTFTNKVYNTSKNFLSDLSHGNLSLDRTRQGLTDYIKKNTQSEFDFDFDFDFDDEDNGEMPEAEAFTAEDYAQGVYESTMATVGAIEISTNKLALMNAKSNNILGDRLIATEMSNMAQSMQMLNTVNDNISGINENLASLIEYNNTTMNDFIKNTAVHFNKVEQFMDMVAKHYAESDDSDEDRENERLKKIADSKIFDGTKIRLGNLFKKAIVSADTEFAGGQGILPALIKLGATAAVGGDENLPKFLKEMYTGDLSMLVETFNPAEILFENLFPGFSGLKGIDNNIKTMFKSFKRKLTRDKSHGGFWKDDSKIGSFFMRLFTDEDEYKPLKTFENKETSWMTSDSEVLQTVIPQYLSDANMHLFGIRSSIDALIGMIDKMGANDIKLDRHLLDFHYNMLKHYARIGSKRERDELNEPLAYIENQKRLADRNYLTSRRRNRQLRSNVKSQEDAYAEANDLIFDETTGALSSRKDILERVETAEKRAYGTGLQAFSNKVSSYIIGDKNEAAVMDSSFSDWENENKDGKASKARKEAYNKAVERFNEFHKEYQKLVQGTWHGSREDLDAQKLLTQVDELLEEYQIDSLSTYQRNALYSLVVDVSEQRKAEISNYDQALSRDRAALKARGIGPDQTYLIRDATRHKERAEAAGTEYDEWNSSLRNTTDMFRAFADAALTDAIRSGQVKEDEDDPTYRALKEDADRRFKGMQSSYNHKMALAESKHVASKNFANYRISAAVDAMLEYSSDLAQEFRDSGIRAVIDKFKDFSPSMFFSEIRDRADDYKSGMKYQIRYNDDGDPIEYYIYSKSKDNWGKRIKVDKSGEGVLEDDPTFNEIWNENIKNGYDQVDDTDFRQFRYKTPKEIKEEQEQSTNEGILHRIQSALGWVDDDDKLYAPTQYKQPNTIGFFATGATRINADQIARVHEGEMILDKSLSQEVRDDIVTMLNNGGYNNMSEEWQQKLLKAIGDSDERFKGHEMEVVKAVNRAVDRYSPETIKSMALRPSDESLCFIDIDENDDPASILVKKLTEMSINLGIMTQTALGTTERENRERGFEKTGKAKNLLLGDKGEGDLRHGGLLSDAYNQIVDDIRYKRFMYIDGKKYTGYTRDEAGNIIEGAGLKSYHATGENATETKNIMDQLRAKAKENAFAYAETQGWSNDRTWSYVKTVDSLVQGIPGAVKGGLIGLTLSGVLGSAIGIMGGFTLGNKETREYIFGKVETDSNGRKYVSGGVFGGFTNRLIEAGEDIKTNFKSAFSDVTNNLKLGFKSFLKRITDSNEDSVGNGIAKFLEQVVTGKDGTIVTRFLNSLKNTVGRVAEGATDIAIDAVTIGSKLMFKAASVPFNVFASIIGGKEYRADKKKERRAARSKQLKEIYNELIFNDSLIGINPDHDITKMFPKIKTDVKNKFNNIKGGVISGWTSLQNRLAEENGTYKRLNRTRHILGKGGYLSDLPSNIANRWDRLGYINEHYYKAQGKLPHLLGRSGMIDDYVVNPLKRFGASAATAAGKVKEKGKTVFDKMSEGISSIGKALTGEYGQSILRGLMGAILATPLAITGHPILAGSVLAAGTANAIFKQILGTGMLGIFSTGLKAIGGRVKNITKPIGEFIGNRVHAVKERLGIDDSKFYFRRMMRGSHIDRGGMLSDLGYTTEEQQRYFELMKKDPSELSKDERDFINDIQDSVSMGHRSAVDDEEAQRVFNEDVEYKKLKNRTDLTPEEKDRLKELTATAGDRKWYRFKRNNGLTDFAIKHGRGKSALKKLNNLSIDDFNLAKSTLDFKSTLSSRITPEMFASMGITDTDKMNKIQAEADKELKKLKNAVIKRFGSLDAAMDYPEELRAMIMQSGFEKNEQALNGKTAQEMVAFLRNGDTQSIIQEQNFRETLLNVVPVMGQTIKDIYEGLKKAFFEKKPASGDLYHKKNEDMAANAFDGENYSTAEHTSDELKDKLKESLANPEKETKGLIDKVSDAYEDVQDVMKPGVDYSDLLKQIGAPEVSSSIPEAGGELITNAFQLIPAKASGATNIDVDGLYKLHKGEIVLDPESANSFRRNIGTGGLDSNALTDISASLRVLSGRDVKKPNKLFNLFGGDEDSGEDGKEGGIKGIFSSMKEKLSGLLNVFNGDKTGSDEEKKSFLDKIGESFAGVGQKISGAVMGSGLIPLKPDGTIDTGKLAARALALLGGIVLFGPAVLKIIDKLAPLLQPIFDTLTTTIKPLIFGEDGKGGLINGIGDVITNVIRTVSGAQDGETTIHAIGRGIHEAWVHVGGAIFENTPTGKQLEATSKDNSVIQNSKDFSQIKTQISKDVDESGISSDNKSKYLNDILNNQPAFIAQLSEYYANVTKFGAAYASAKNLDDVTSLPFGSGISKNIERANSETIKTGVKNYLTSDEYAYIEKYSLGANLYDREAFTKVAQNLTNVKLGYSSDTKSWYIKEYASKEDAERFSQGKASRVKQGLSILVKRNNTLVKAYDALIKYGHIGATGIRGDALNFVDSVFNTDDVVLNPIPAKSYEELSSDDEVNMKAYGNVGYGYTQNDPRWARQSYGSFKSGRGSTIGSGGCGPTAMANVYSNLTGRKVNPGQMARFSQSNGYNAQGGTSAGLFTNGARKLGLASKAISKSGNAIGNSIRHGNNVVIAGKNGPYTRAGHIMSVRGVDSRGNAIVDDPLKRGARHIPMNRLTKGMTHAWSIGRGNSIGYGRHVGDANSPYSTWDDELIDGNVTFNRNGGAFGYTGALPDGCVYNSFVNAYLNSILSGSTKFSDIAASFSPTTLLRHHPEVNNPAHQVVYENAYKRLVEIFGTEVPWRESNYDFLGADGVKYNGSMEDFFRLLYANLSAGNPIVFSSNNGTSAKMKPIISRTANPDEAKSNNQHGVLLAGLYKNSAGEEFVVVDNPNTGAEYNGKSNQIYTVPMETFRNAVSTAVYPDIRRVVIFGKNAVKPATRNFVKQKPEDMFKAMKTAAASNDAASEAFLKTFPDGNKYDTYSAWASAHPDLAKTYSDGMGPTNSTYASGNTTTTGTAYTPMAVNYDSGNIFASGLTQNMNAGGSKDAKSVSEWIANLVSDLTDFGFNLIGSIISGDKSLLYSSSRSAGSYSDAGSGISGGGTSGYASNTDTATFAAANPQLIIDAAFVKSSIDSAYSAYSSNTEVNSEFNKNGLSKYTINPGNYASLTNDSRYNQLLIDIAASANYKKYVTQTTADIYTWLVAQKAISQYPDEKMYAYASKYSSGGIGSVIDNIASEMYNKIKGMQIASGQPTDDYTLLPSWAKTSAGNGIPAAGNEVNTLHYLMDLMTKAETGGDIKNPADIDKIYFNPIWLSGESGVTIGRGGFYNANAKTVFTTAAKSPSLSETTRNMMNTIAAGIGNHSLNPSDIKSYIELYPDMKPALITAQDAMMNEYAWDYISRAAAQYNKRGMKDPRSIILGAEFAGVAPATVPSFYSAVTNPGASNELDQVRQGMFNTISGFSNYGRYGKGWRNRINGMYSMITSEGNGKNPWNGIYYPLPAHIISSIPSNMNLIPTSIGNGDAGYNMRDNDNIYTNDVYMGDADNPMHVVMDSSPVTSRIDKLIELIDSAVNPKEVTQAGPSNAKSNSIGHGEPNVAQAPTMSATKGQSSIGQKDRLAQLHSKLAKRTRTNLNYNHL